MEYRYLGRSGLKVSAFALGTLTFGRETPEDESHALLDHFLAAGGNFIDTADVYSRGGAESVLGRWLRRQERDDLIIATKARYPMGPGPNEAGASRKHLIASVENSLRRLQTEYIDLYQLHCWDHATPLEETFATLDTLVRGGKVRYIGVSNYAGWQVAKATMLCRQHGWAVPVSAQPQYNLLCRSVEWEVLPACAEGGLGVLPWSPLRGGWLSGRYRRDMDAPPNGSRVAEAEAQGWGESWSAYNTPRTWEIVDTLFAVAAEAGKTPSQVALSWLLQRPGVAAPIIGARTMAHLIDNLGGMGWSFEGEQGARLDAVSDPGLPYPYDEIASARSRR